MRLAAVSTIAAVIVLLSNCTPQAPVVPPDPVTLKDTTIINVAYGENTFQKLDIGLPANRTGNTSLVMVIHGGGWNEGDKSDLAFMTDGLKQRGFAVANINYRLSPQSADNYAMQLDDVDAAVQFTLSKAGQYVFNDQKLYVVGHSAGGHLALCYAYTRNVAGKVKAVGSLAAPTSLWNMAYYNQAVYGSLLTPYLGMPLIPVSTASDLRYKNTSPLFQADTHSPPTILFHGDADLVINQEQSSFLANKLSSLNIDNKYIVYSPLVGHDWFADNNRRNNTLDELKLWFTNH